MDLSRNPEACRTEIANSGNEHNAVLAYWGQNPKGQFWSLMASLGLDDQATTYWDEAMAFIRSVAMAKNIGWNAYHWTLKA